MNSNIVLKNLLWRFFERCGAQGVTFLVTIYLARLIEPKVYGMVALVMVFTEILQVFVDSGLGNALIQKKDVDTIDFSSVFYFNIFSSILLYCLLFVAAQPIAKFYNMHELVSIIRVIGLILIISGIKNVQQAYVSRNLLFKKFFFSTLIGTIISGIVGIAMAYRGFGIWALVIQYLLNLFIDTCILWISVDWRPTRQFSFGRLKILFSFGWKLLLSALLEVIYHDLRQLIIGKLYSPVELAQYNQGKKIPNVIVTNINSSIDSVLLPAMSKAQDQKNTVKLMTRRSIEISTYVMMPLMVGLAVCAEPLVKIVLTEKWLPCIPFLRVFCFSFAFYPIHTANLNAIKAMGRSDIFLKLEIVKKIVALLAILLTMNISVMAMAYSLFVTSILSQIINAFPNAKLLNYSYFEQLNDIFPQICISVVMGVVVSLVQFMCMSDGITLLFQIIVGGCIYVFLSQITKNDSYNYLITIIKQFFQKGKRN